MCMHVLVVHSAHAALDLVLHGPNVVRHIIILYGARK